MSATGTNVSITVNVKTAPSVAQFECTMRLVKPGNVTHDQVKLSFPTASAGAYYTIRGIQLSMPGASSLPAAVASVNMRCAVPNVIGNVEAGIVSYRIDW